MEIYRIAAIVELYRKRLAAEGIEPKRIDIDKTFGDCTRDELLAQAHYLASNMQTFMYDPDKYGRTNRHLTAIQMCLSFAKWYTLRELMDHNRPVADPEEPEREPGPRRTHDDFYKNPFRR